MRTHSHAFVHIVHFFVEIVVDTGYWIHLSLDRLHLGFKPVLFTVNTSEMWKYSKQFRKLDKNNCSCSIYKLLIVIHSSEELQKSKCNHCWSCQLWFEVCDNWEKQILLSDISKCGQSFDPLIHFWNFDQHYPEA